MTTIKNQRFGFNFSSIDLSLSAYQLADLNVFGIKDNLGIDESEIDGIRDTIQKHINQYDVDDVEEILGIQDKHNAIELFIKGLRDEFLLGKIKTDGGTSYRSPSVKKLSLKASISRVGREQDFAVGRILNLTYNDTYEIPHGYGWSLSMGLSKINTEEGFNELLLYNRAIEVIEKLNIMAISQHRHRLENNVTYQRYMEIQGFQEESGVILSKEIMFGKDIKDDEINYLYDRLPEVKKKQKELDDLIKQIKNNA